MTIIHSFRLTQATLDDADDVVECLREAFEPYQKQYTAAAYADTVPTIDDIRTRIRNTTVFIARDETGRLIGAIGASARGAEGHLRGMAVIPSAQGHGVAEELLDAAEAELIAAGCSAVTLDTTAPLARAIRFYERNGYARSGVVSDFFGMRLYEFKKSLRQNAPEAQPAVRVRTPSRWSE